MMNRIIAATVSLVLLFGFGAADQNAYYKRTGAKFLEKVKKENPNVKALKSGMLIEVLVESSNPDAKSPRPSDACDVTYSGTLRDGTKFDAGTTSFAPNQVIKAKMNWNATRHKK